MCPISNLQVCPYKLFAALLFLIFGVLATHLSALPTVKPRGNERGLQFRVIQIVPTTDVTLEAFLDNLPTSAPHLPTNERSQALRDEKIGVSVLSLIDV